VLGGVDREHLDRFEDVELLAVPAFVGRSAAAENDLPCGLIEQPQVLRPAAAALPWVLDPRGVFDNSLMQTKAAAGRL
jgi:hypothetical protein